MSGTPALEPRTTVRPVPDAGPTTGLPQLVVLLATSCLSVLGAVLIAPVLPQMTDAFGDVPGVDVLVPVVLTVPSLVIGLTAPFAGWIADAVDRRRLVLVALVAYAILGTAPLYLSTLPLVIASRVLLGLCEAAIMTSCTTLIGDYWSGARRSRYLALQTLVAALAATVFLGLGGALGAAGWRTPFWIYVVALVLVVPFAVLIWSPVRRSPREGRELEALPWRLLLAPCLVTLLGGVVFYALIVQLSFVLDDAGVGSTAVIGGISAVMSVATAAGSLVFARLSGRTPRVLLPVEFGAAAVGLVIVSATGSVPVITVGAVLTGVGTGMLLPTLLTWAVNRLDFQQRGRGTGLWTGALFIGQFLSPLIIAAVGAAAGGLRPALAVLGAACVVLAGLAVPATRRNSVPLDVTND